MPLCYFVPYPANHGFETAGRSDANNFTAKIVTLGSYRPAEPVRNKTNGDAVWFTWDVPWI